MKATICVGWCCPKYDDRTDSNAYFINDESSLSKQRIEAKCELSALSNGNKNYKEMYERQWDKAHHSMEHVFIQNVFQLKIRYTRSEWH